MNKALALGSCLVVFATAAYAETIPVTPENFEQAETAWNFTNWAKLGSDEKIFHFRDPAPAGREAPTVRMNWDTLYSARIVKVADDHKFTITLPESDLYISAEVFDEYGFSPYYIVEKGTHEVSVSTDYAMVAFRTRIIDRNSEEAMRKVRDAQDRIQVSDFMEGEEYVAPDYDQEQLEKLREAYKKEFLASGMDFTYAKGPGEVDQHILNLSHAAGWGGYPPELGVSNSYLTSDTMSGDVCRAVTFDDPKNKFFTSFIVYDADGYIIGDDGYINSDIWKPNDDGTITLHFNCGDDAVNNLSSEGQPFNYTIRNYGVSQMVMDGDFRPLKPEVVSK